MELPKYKCHKEVNAAKIEHIKFIENSDAIRLVFGEGLGTIDVSAVFVHKHNPVIGSYYVLYQDGYESISPAQAFEEGYTIISENK